MFCKRSEKSVFNLVTLFIYVFLVLRSVKCEDETTTTTTTDTTTVETTTLLSLIEEDRGIKSGETFANFSTKNNFEHFFTIENWNFPGRFYIFTIRQRLKLIPPTQAGLSLAYPTL